MIDPLAGQTFGQYELQEPLGRGGMASVYRALQPSLGRSVAVKVLSLSQLPDPTLPERFRREARMAANLLHPNIVPVYDFGEWNGHLFIVMALLSGGTLRERMHGPMPMQLAIRLVNQVADALGYAHGQGIFHRDVKPTNLLLASGDWTMLSDFGIARALGDTTRLTNQYGTVGTPAYMAPEQWLGGEIDGRADLYSLGIVLYEMLTGRPPFTATTAQGLMRQHLEASVPTLSDQRPDLPHAFDVVLRTMLAKLPEHRYRHAGEFKAALETAIREGQTPSSHSRTNLVGAIVPQMDNPDLGQTVRVSRLQQTPAPTVLQTSNSRLPTFLLALVLILAVLLAVAVGFIAAGGRFGAAPEQAATQPTQSAAIAAPNTPPVQAVVPTATLLPTVAPTPATIPPTLVAPTPPPAIATPAPPPPKPVVAQPAPTTSIPATGATSSDPRQVLVERHIADYFAALNTSDYARAQAVCCTAGWRSRYPLDEWRKNFAGVTDLRFSTPARYTIVEPTRIVAEVDYSFANSSGARRFFTLRWTFVPVGNDWLADDAVASPQR